MQWWVAVRLHQPLVAHSQWEHWQVHKSSWQRAQKSELHSTHSNNKKKIRIWRADEAEARAEAEVDVRSRSTELRV